MFLSVVLIKDFEIAKIMFAVRSALVFTLTGDKPPHLNKYKLGAIVWQFLVFIYLFSPPDGLNYLMLKVLKLLRSSALAQAWALCLLTDAERGVFIKHSF